MCRTWGRPKHGKSHFQTALIFGITPRCTFHKSELNISNLHTVDEVVQICFHSVYAMNGKASGSGIDASEMLFPTQTL